jgi:uncharacterized lipoprotein NlpE involved in copper resistance
MAKKSAVYAWRVSPALKASLEEAARAERRSVAQLLDEIVADHLRVSSGRDAGATERQLRLHARAARFAGRLSGHDPGRAARARELVRDRLLRARHAR